MPFLLGEDRFVCLRAALRSRSFLRGFGLPIALGASRACRDPVWGDQLGRSCFGVWELWPKQRERRAARKATSPSELHEELVATYVLNPSWPVAETGP